MYLAAGLAWGGVFWVKESVALLYLPVFLFLSVFRNRFSGPWLWLLTGMAFAVLANCALMNQVAGNPMHIFAVMGKGLESYTGVTVETSPSYYLRYLFIDVKHTFLLGYLALAGTILFARYFVRAKLAASGAQFVVIWAFLMLGMFSFAIVSFSPVTLISKQTNYMLIFTAPIALLAGWFLESLPWRTLVVLSAFVVCGSIVFAALEQQAITVFTANSKAVYALLRDHPKAFVIGTTNNQRATTYYSMMANHKELRDRVLSFGEMESLLSPDSAETFRVRVAGKELFAVVDLQNIDWGNKPGAIRRLADVPKCWVSAGKLTPAEPGTGRWITRGLVAAVALAPESLVLRFMSILQPVFKPAPAYLFKVDDSCLPGSPYVKNP